MVSPAEPNPVSSSTPDDEDNAGSNPPGESQSDKRSDGPKLIDELGVEDLSRTYVRMNGREFAAAGRKIPVAEIDYHGMVMYHPEMPLNEAPGEVISVECDQYGIVLNELGDRRKVAGARYQGHEIFWHRDTIPGSSRHYIAWYDEEWNAHSLFLVGSRVTVDMVLKMRSRTVNGELSVFAEVTSD